MAKRIGMKCPHCERYLKMNGSKQITALYKELNSYCECGFVSVMTLEIVREISPSSQPNQAINLPLSSRHKLNRVRHA